MTAALYLLRRYWLHILVAAALAYALWAAYSWAWQDGWDERDAEFQAHLLADVRAELAAQVAARVTERRQAVAIADITEQYERDKADAIADADRLAADLRAGNVRLQKHWAGCETSNLSGDATAARLADEAARLRAESAARIVAAADEADAQVRGLQRYAEEVSK